MTTDPSLRRTIEELRETFPAQEETARWTREIGVIGLLLGLAAVIYWSAQLTEKNSSILILQHPFDVAALAPEKRWMGTAIEQGVRANLLIHERVRLVNTSDRLRLANANLPQSAGAQPGGWVLHSVLKPSALEQPALLQLDLVLEDLANDRTHRASLTGDPRVLADLANRYVQQLRAWLQLPAPDMKAQVQALAALPAAPEARRAYAEGQLALRHHDASGAIEVLERAAAIEPDHPLIQMALAQAWSQLGYESRAATHALAAFKRRGSLSREQQLAIEGRYRINQQEWPRAQEVYRALWEFQPTDMNYGLTLVDTQMAAGDMTRAHDTIAQMRALPEPLAADPRIDLLEAIVFWREGDWQRGLPPIDRAIVKARQASNNDMLASALRWKFELSDTPELEWLEEAQSRFTMSGNLRGQTDVLQSRAIHARGQGRLAEAEQLFEAALTLSEAMGNEAETSQSQADLAIVMDLYGRLEDGLHYKQQVLASRQRRALALGVAIAKENIGHSLLKLGRTRDARQWFAEAGAEFAMLGDKIGIAWRPYHQARVALLRGELGVARAQIELAIENSQTRPEGHLQAHSRFVEAQIDLFSGNWEQAAAAFRRLIDDYDAAGLRLDAAESRIGLAAARRALDPQADTLGLIDRASEVFAREQAGYYLQGATIERIDALLATHRSDDREIVAPQVRQHCADATNNTEHGEVRLRTAVRTVICRELLGNHVGQPEALVDLLSEIQREAAALSLLQPRLEVLRALSWIHDRHGNVEQSTAYLRQAEQLASQHGWRLKTPW